MLSKVGLLTAIRNQTPNSRVTITNAKACLNTQTVKRGDEEEALSASWPRLI